MQAVVIHHLCCSLLLEGDSSHSSPASPWGPSCKRQSCMNFSSVSHSCREWWNQVHQEQTAPACVPNKVTLCCSCQQTCSSPLVQGPDRILLPMGSQPPSGIHLLQCGVLHRLQEDLRSSMDFTGLQGHSLHHHGLHPRLQGVPSTYSTSVPPSTLTWLSAELFISHTLIRRSWMQLWRFSFFFSSCLNIPEALPLLLTLTGGRSLLEPAGIGSLRHCGKLLAPS